MYYTKEEIQRKVVAWRERNPLPYYKEREYAGFAPRTDLPISYTNGKRKKTFLIPD